MMGSGLPPFFFEGASWVVCFRVVGFFLVLGLGGTRLVGGCLPCVWLGSGASWTCDWNWSLEASMD